MNSNPAPNFGLLSSVDISGFTGNLLTRSNTVSSSNFTTKVFEDMISFLNGRGMSSGLDLSSQLLAQSAGNFTDWHIGIDANDKVELSATHAFRIKFNSSSTLAGNTDILGIGESTWDTRFPMWALVGDAICKQNKHGLDTFAEIHRVLKWDWEQLLAGEFFELNPWGKKWPKGSTRRKQVGSSIAADWFFGLYSLRADMDWHTNVLLSYP